ncbi:MAG: HD domain-containing protein [Calditrichaeota bacterium]|nr:HD domain-containing protein [Calditrichota bacterium]
MNKKRQKLTTELVLKEIGALTDETGISVWAVGGFVRDKLLNRTVTDIDFAVVGDGPKFARQVAKRLGTKTVVVFERFGTAMVHVGNFKLEFVGTRKEEYLPDSRKPIVTESSLDDDLLRRDFTINAIAMGLNEKNFGELYDPLGGKEDLQKKIIRTPLEPEVTFKDDPLRILRAIRFAARFDFEIEEKTFSALKKTASRLKIISQERVTDELMKMLEHDKPSLAFQLMDETGVLELILPEISVMKGVEQRAGYHHKDVFKHTLMVVDNVAAVSKKLELRFTALFHDVGKPVTKQFIDGIGWTFHGHDEIGARMLGRICRRLKLPNQLMKYAQKLTRLHLRPISLSEETVTDSAIRRLIVQTGDDLDDLITLCRADITSQNPQRVKKHLQNFDHVVRRIAEVEEKDKMRAFQSPVRGEEIMEVCGLKPGPKVGKLKKMIEEAILEGEIPNEHDAALEFLLKIKDDVINESVE